MITTEVDPGSVKCYSNSGLDNPDMSDETMSNAELRYMEYQAGRYEEAEKLLAEYTQFVVDSKRYMWEWDNRRFVANDSVMLVDGGIRLTAEREKPSDLIHENSSPHLTPPCTTTKMLSVPSRCWATGTVRRHSCSVPPGRSKKPWRPIRQPT